jgi:hypothetical protein
MLGFAMAREFSLALNDAIRLARQVPRGGSAGPLKARQADRDRCAALENGDTWQPSG